MEGRPRAALLASKGDGRLDSARPGRHGVTAYIDFTRELIDDQHCYQISAVAAGSVKSVRAAEICLSGL